MLRSDASDGARFVVIGGGFIGSEVAASLRMQGNEVTIVFPGEALSQRIFPAEMAAYLNDYYREHGVEVLPGETVTDILVDGEKATAITANGRHIPADRVVAGIGILPNVDLARERQTRRLQRPT